MMLSDVCLAVSQSDVCRVHQA